MLILEKPYIEKNRLCANIKIDDETYTMWFEVEKDYIEYLCYEKADAFLVAIIPYIIKHELDVEVKGKISSKLYYQLTTYLIPLLCDNFNKRKISLICELDNSHIKTQNAVGTGISCGIDSFYTIFKHLNLKEKEFNITHLTFFNAGSHGQFGGDESRELYNARKEQSRKFAEENNLKFVCVDSNMNEFIMMSHEKTHTFRSLACVLALQKLFSKYYYSSGFDFNETRIDEFDTAYYDILNMQCLSTENIEFYCTGIEVTRIMKVKEIVKYEPSYNWLNVCVRENNNCGECEKCIRTLLELDSVKSLYKYKNVFNLNDFYNKRNRYLSFMLKQKRQKNIYYIEIYNQYKKNNFKIPFTSYLKSLILSKGEIKNIIKKILPNTILNKIRKTKKNNNIDDSWAIKK